MERALVRPPVRRLPHLALVAALAAAPLACGGDDDDDNGGTGPNDDQPPPQQVAINISNFAFRPRVDTVRVGGTVTWTNSDADPHTSTSSASPAAWDSGTLSTGGTFSQPFPNAGSFPYICTIHPTMTGTIVAR